MEKITCKAQIHSVIYKSTSYYGNPKYKVSFTNLENQEYYHAETGNNYAVGYSIRNYNGIECELTYHFTKTGNCIIDHADKCK